jgi:hypothetical protein
MTYKDNDDLYTVHLPTGNQLPSAAKLHPTRTDTKTTDAAAEDAALLTEIYPNRV